MIKTSLSVSVALLTSVHLLQVIWCPGPCTTSSRCTSRTPATGPRSTRRPPPQCTGSRRPSTLCVTSCTARRWNGRTPTWSRPKSPYRLRGESGFGQCVGVSGVPVGLDGICPYIMLISDGFMLPLCLSWNSSNACRHFCSLAQVFCPHNDPIRCCVGRSALTPPRASGGLMGIRGDFTRTDGWTDISASFLHPDDPAEHKEWQAERRVSRLSGPLREKSLLNILLNGEDKWQKLNNT